jgi:hypothetical protein
LVSLFQKHNGDGQIFFTNFVILQTKNLGTYWLKNCVFTGVHSSNLPIFLLKIQILNMTNLGKKEKTQQEGALNQSNKISKISKICPTIIVHNIIRE